MPVAAMSAALMTVLAARWGPPAARIARRAADALAPPRRLLARGVRVWPAESGSGTASEACIEAPRLGPVKPGAGSPPAVGAAPADDAPSRAANQRGATTEASGGWLLQPADSPAVPQAAATPHAAVPEAAAPQPAPHPGEEDPSGEAERGADGEECMLQRAVDDFHMCAPSLFEGGTPLGAGGQGEVRRIELWGMAFAVKQTSYFEGGDMAYADVLPRAWVQLPLAVDTGATLYQLLPLAAGDLGHAIAALEERGQPLAPAEFRAVLAELVVAVGAIHAAGLRHADIKPANFLITPTNHVIVCDLGMTSDAEDSARGWGTVGFAAPEQASLGCTALDVVAHAWEWVGDALLRRPPRDQRPIDVHALGVTCFCMLGADWRGARREAAAARGGWGRRRWVPPAWVPAAAAPLLKGMLARRPGRRPTMEQIRAHPFFEGVDWAAVEARRVPLPLDLAALATAGRRGFARSAPLQATA
ncbi:hypothetical protein Rsub_08897 [Raphidocelis subcapitata]|uniref:Protein kinase domain-containing protein n=1 Tax=Raphidocelis subcapitata TaxID=307507 RepID=A0A2V0P9A4_9CHLO|nr:hypothetical protein Rsub_08897 [Raphidocelis subcapitata]|eukprot:GBF96149.1 hypothetical protein Rsub_08897 [Raphidocelis subcapitata]